MRRWLKRTLWALAVVIGLPLLAVLLLYTFSDTGPGRRSIEALADFFTGGDVRIAGLDGSFPNAIRASHVELKDDDGVVWLILDDVSLEWSPWGFLSDDVAIASAHARHAKVVRLPVSHSTDTTPGMTRYTIGSAVIDQAE
ncbi:MAG TPA: hypothetical protein VHL34_12805, partial [Rhizomicrobium sp.]|nr:hypothetical protein [Rhizomicrobium sp.]